MLRTSRFRGTHTRMFVASLAVLRIGKVHRVCVRRDARRRPPLGSQLGRQVVEPLRVDAQVEEAEPAGGSHLCLVRVRVRVRVSVRGRGSGRGRVRV